MKPKILLHIGFVAVAFITLRGEPAINLQAWHTGDASGQSLTQDEALILPAGAQLYRTITGAGITLRITSNPVFSAEPDEVAILEFGTNAFAFTQTADTGRITLLQGDRDPKTLSYIIALDETDHAIEPLSLELTQRGDTLFVTAHGETLQVASEPLAGTTPIVLSTGASQNWTINELSVTSEPLSGPEPTGVNGTNPASSTGSASQTSITSPATLLPGLTSGLTSDPTAATDSALSPTASATAGVTADPEPVPTLEIFTPPPVRHGRAEAVRIRLTRVQAK